MTDFRSVLGGLWRGLGKRFDDPLSAQMLKGSAVSMGVRVAGMVTAFLSHIMLSRTLGVTQYGSYVIALGWAMVLVIVARLGLDNATLRFATIYREEGRTGALRGLILFSIAAIAAAATGITVVLLGAKWLDAEPLRGISWFLLLGVVGMIFPLAVLGWLSALIRTAHKIFAAQFYEQLLRPALLIAGIVIVGIAGAHLDAELAMALTVASTTIACLCIALQARASLPTLTTTRSHFGERRHWLSVGWTLLLLTLFQETLNQVDVLLLGILADATAAGHFSAASRLASLVPFGLVAIVTVSGPLIASAYRRNATNELARIARSNARFAFAFALAMAVFLAAVGRLALGAFGPSFEMAYPVLIVLLAGGLVNAFTGAVGYFMLMTGHQAAALAIVTAALLVSVTLNVLLIPGFGIMGSAIASIAALSLWNIATLLFVRRKLGVDASVIGLSPRRG